MKKYTKKTTTKKAPKKKSRYGDVSAAGNRTPQFDPGDYIVALSNSRTSDNTRDEYYHIDGEVVTAEGKAPTEVGETRHYMQTKNLVGIRLLKSMVMAIAGYDDEEEYDAFDPDGECMEFVLDQEQNDYAELFGDDLDGRQVGTAVTLGSPVLKDGEPTGDHYRNHDWYPAPDVERWELPEEDEAE